MFSQLLRSLSIFAVALRILAEYLWLDFMARFRSQASHRAAEARAYSRWGGLLRKKALRLRGLIIKVGQFLSTRADVLPQSFTRELTALQDAIPAAPYAAIRQRVEAELAAPLDTVFAEFETEALASASLGQVHRARLKAGQTVAVKVLRPGIERLVRTDMAAVRKIMWFLDRFSGVGRRIDIPAMMAEFQTITYQEMDYRQEAENIRRFRKNFASVAGIDVPFPFDNLVTERLLVMEYKSGMKLTERDRLLAASINPQQLAERLIDAYLKQILVDGFVHVDPHPGNLMAQPDGTLVFLDFGMMGTITPEDRTNFAALVTTLVTRDLDGAVRALEALGFVRHRAANNDILKKALGYFLDQVSGVKLQPGPEMDRFLVDLREWLYEEPLQFPARYIFIGRAVGLLSGLASALDPTIDWVNVLKERALPLLTGSGAREAGGRTGWFDWRKTLNNLFGAGADMAVDLALKQGAATGLSLVRLPSQLERVLAQVEAGSLQVQTDLAEATARLDRQAHLVNRLTWTVLLAGAGVAGAVLRAAGLSAEARWAWGFGAVALFLLLVNLITARRPRRRRPARRDP